MEDKFCPILLIGMPPPKEFEDDLRLCTPNCKWYDDTEQECLLVLLKDKLDYQNMLVEYEHGYETVREDQTEESDPFYYC